MTIVLLVNAQVPVYTWAGKIAGTGNDYGDIIKTDVAGNKFLIKDTFQKNASVLAVWQAQFMLRYIFGK